MDIIYYIEQFYFEHKDEMTIDQMAFEFIMEMFVRKPEPVDDDELPF